MTDYRIRLHTPAGVLQAEITDYQRLAYTKRLNEPGLLTLQLGGTHPALGLFQHNGQVEVWRRNAALGMPWAVDFRTLVRGDDRQTTQQTVATLQCPGQMVWLADEYTAYAAGVANRTAFSSKAAEYIAWSLVNYNLTSAGTVADGRRFQTPLTQIGVATNLNRGPVLDWNCAWANVLSELQKLANSTNTYFDLVKTGPASWQFQFFPSYPGVDRSADVVFTTARDTMADIRWSYDRTGEKTCAIVGGRGQEADRQVRIRYGPDWSASNHKVLFVNATQATSDAALDAAGDAALQAARARPVISFSARQTASTFYGRDYQVGDLVGYAYNGASGQKLVSGVSVEVTPDGAEKIGVEMRDV